MAANNPTAEKKKEDKKLEKAIGNMKPLKSILLTSEKDGEL